MSMDEVQPRSLEGNTMREAEYPDADEDTREGRKTMEVFRKPFVMTHRSDSFGTLRAVDAMLAAHGLEIVTLGDGADPKFKIDKLAE